MLEKLLPYELDLFFLINSSHTPFWDQVMRIYSGIYVWIPVIICLLIIIIYGKKRQEWLPVILALLSAVIVGLLLSSAVTKPLFARLRPIYYPSVMDNVRTLYNGMPDLYGFISGHSSTAFTIAMFTALLFKRKLYSWVVFTWALIMAYSRVYLGVHFISDLVGGTLAGFLIGYLAYVIYLKVVSSFRMRRKGVTIASYSARRINVFVIGVGFYIVLFVATSKYLVNFFNYF